MRTTPRRLPVSVVYSAGLPTGIAGASHAEDAKAAVPHRPVERRRQAQPQHHARVLHAREEAER